MRQRGAVSTTSSGAPTTAAAPMDEEEQERLIQSLQRSAIQQHVIFRVVFTLLAITIIATLVLLSSRQAILMSPLAAWNGLDVVPEGAGAGGETNAFQMHQSERVGAMFYRSTMFNYLLWVQLLGLAYSVIQLASFSVRLEVGATTTLPTHDSEAAASVIGGGGAAAAVGAGSRRNHHHFATASTLSYDPRKVPSSARWIRWTVHALTAIWFSSVLFLMSTSIGSTKIAPSEYFIAAVLGAFPQVFHFIARSSATWHIEMLEGVRDLSGLRYQCKKDA